MTYLDIYRRSDTKNDSKLVYFLFILNRQLLKKEIFEKVLDNSFFLCYTLSILRKEVFRMRYRLSARSDTLRARRKFNKQKSLNFMPRGGIRL